MVKAPAHQNDEAIRSERFFRPHLEVAYNLACWLTGNETNARDIVQDSCLQAFRALPQFNEDVPRAWFLTIVRNQCYTSLGKTSEERIHADTRGDFSALEEGTVLAQNDKPEKILMRLEAPDVVRQALNELPVAYREAVVLKELEEMSYAEIGHVTRLPVGTVMWRISRGRRLLKEILARTHANER